MIGPQSLLKVCKGAAAWEIYVYQHLCLRALGMQKKYCGTIHPLKVSKHWEGKPTQGFESHIPQHQTFKLHFQVVQKSTVPRFKAKANSLRSVFSSMIISSQPKNNPMKIHCLHWNTSDSHTTAFFCYPAGPALRSPRCVHDGALGRRRCEETCCKTSQDIAHLPYHLQS